MSSSYIPINLEQLSLSVLFILINIVLSFALKLGLAQTLVIASLRMVVQLLLIGYVLNWLFTLSHPVPILALGIIMTTIAGISWRSLLSVFISSFLITNLTTLGFIQVQPWYDPQYFIPLLGMVLGNTLTGISLGLDRFMESLVNQRQKIETLLALGATRWEATHEEVKAAIRTGMIPMINSMMVMGIVSLPGMMTGQILAGASPLDAVRYQIIIIFAIA